MKSRLIWSSNSLAIELVITKRQRVGRDSRTRSLNFNNIGLLSSTAGQGRHEHWSSPLLKTDCRFQTYIISKSGFPHLVFNVSEVQDKLRNYIWIENVTLSDVCTIGPSGNILMLSIKNFETTSEPLQHNTGGNFRHFCWIFLIFSFIQSLSGK